MEQLYKYAQEKVSKSILAERTLFYAHQEHNQNKYQNENYVKKGYISKPK